MARAATVRVHDDLATGQAGVRDRPAADEPARRVDVPPGVHVEPLGGDRLLDDLPLYVIEDLLLGHVLCVLDADEHGVDAPRRAVIVVLHRDLRFAVRAGPAQHAASAALGEPARELVRELNRSRHQLGRLVARVAEHHPLVSGAADIDPQGDVR